MLLRLYFKSRFQSGELYFQMNSDKIQLSKKETEIAAGESETYGRKNGYYNLVF